MRKTRSRELANSPQVPQPTKGRQSRIGAQNVTGFKPGHLLLKSSDHKAHSLSPPTVPGPAQLPLPPGSPHPSIRTPRSVLPTHPQLVLAQRPHSRRRTPLQKQQVEKAQKPRPEGKEARPGPTPGISLLAVGWDQAEQDGWVGRNVRRRLPSQLGPWLAAISAGHGPAHCWLTRACG